MVSPTSQSCFRCGLGWSQRTRCLLERGTFRWTYVHMPRPVEVLFRMWTAVNILNILNVNCKVESDAACGYQYCSRWLMLFLLSRQAACWSVLLSGVSWTDVYVPSHGASSRHGVQRPRVWNTDYWLWRGRHHWHSKCRDTAKDVATKACEHTRCDRSKPNWQRWRHAVALVRPAVCHYSAPCVCNLCTPDSIPRTAGRDVFDKQCRWGSSVSPGPTVTCQRCPSSKHALICWTCFHVVGSKVDKRINSLLKCLMFVFKHVDTILYRRSLMFVRRPTDVGLSLKHRFYRAKGSVVTMMIMMVCVCNC